MIYKIYLPNKTKEKLIFKGTVEIVNIDDDQEVVKVLNNFAEEKITEEEICISNQGEEGLSIWKNDEVYCLLEED